MNDVADADRKAARNGLWLSAGAVIGAAFTVGAVVLAAAIFVTSPPDAGAVPSFVEEAQAAGIVHSYEGDFEFFVGGGVAVFDCDDDGRQDMYLAGGSSAASLYRNQSALGGELQFAVGGDAATQMTDVLGAYPIDIDSDRNLDLMVLRLGENVALRGLGDCRFERANEDWGIDGGDEWTAAFSAKWEPGNELPTLAFGNYLEWPVDRSESVSCADNTLLRPEGDRYGAPIALSPGWCTLSVLFTDWDRSHRIDLRVANDRHYYIAGTEQMWRVAPGEEPRLYTPEEGWNEIKIWGMGIASQDVTGDGLPEFFITSQGDNKLQTLEANAGQPTYRDIAIQYGVTAHRPFVGDNTLPSTGWHPEFQDVNNDGYLDLLITKGNVEAMVEYTMADPNNLLIGQPDGSFIEVADESGVASTARSRGAALADFNLDGKLDLVVVNRVENAQLWRNRGETGNWLGVQLRQPGSNTYAVGAIVEVETGGHIVSHEETIGGGHAGDQLGWIHFGLGEASRATIRVSWPDGSETEATDVPANSFVILNPSEEPEFWEPKAP